MYHTQIVFSHSYFDKINYLAYKRSTEVSRFRQECPENHSKEIVGHEISRVGAVLFH